MARILVVDDRPINREFLVTLLGYAGHSTQQAADGAEAMRLVRRDPPDLVISDILMPILDGVELARRMAADPRLARIPVVFYTATYRLSEAKSLAESCGVSTVIPKPCDPQELIDAVNRELGIRSQATNVTQLVRTVRPALSTTQQLCAAHVDELSELQTQFRSTLERAASVPERGTLKQLYGRLDTSVVQAQALSMRLSALVELGLDLADQTDAVEMLDLFCRAARDILNAKHAAVCVLDENGVLQHFVAWGMSEPELEEVRRALAPTAGLFGELLRVERPRRISHLAGAPASIGLPASHPPIDSLLAVPLKTKDRTYGWFYVADRLAADQFGDADEQLAVTIASLLAPQVENKLLYERLARHARELEVEIDERKQAIEHLRESELRFRQLAENIQEVFLLMDAVSGQTLYVSPTYQSIWERSREGLYEQPWSWLDTVHPGDQAKTRAALVSTRDAGVVDAEFRIVRPDGGMRWIRLRSFPIRDTTGAVYRIAGLAEDISEKKLQQLSIERLSRIHAVLSGINSALVRIHERQPMLDEACRIAVEQGGFPIAWIAMREPEASRLRPVAHRGIDGDTLAELEGYLAAGVDQQWEPGRRALYSKELHVVNDLWASVDSAMGPVAKRALALGYGSFVTLPLIIDEELIGVMVLYAEESGFFDAQELELLKELAADVSFALQYIAKTEQLDYLAYYDSLTGLPNAKLFQERVSQVIDRKPDSKTALFLVDLDHFAHVNDSLGRHIGDKLLSSVGWRLRETLAEPNSLARISADMFAIAASELKHETEAGVLLQEKILAALNRPLELDGTELRMSARAGIAVYPNDGENSETLFKNAEAALRQAKSSGARYLFYSPQLNSRVAEELALEQKLLAAVAAQEFKLHYQPKVDTRTGKITGLEALLRWDSPSEGLVEPARFVRALEDSELIIDVGRWVLEQALADWRRWRHKGLRAPRIAVNVSPVQLRYADFPDMVFAAIDASGGCGEALELEITESVIMGDIESNTTLLKRLCDIGVTIAIDDFGTGHSSLRYLAKLPVQSLKIDRSFIVAMIDDPHVMTLVTTIVGLAHSLKLSVVAEGVDSDRQAEVLHRIRCDSMQGYLFGKPLPPDEIDHLLPLETPPYGSPE